MPFAVSAKLVVEVEFVLLQKELLKPPGPLRSEISSNSCFRVLLMTAVFAAALRNLAVILVIIFTITQHASSCTNKAQAVATGAGAVGHFVVTARWPRTNLEAATSQGSKAWATRGRSAAVGCAGIDHHQELCWCIFIDWRSPA